MDQEESKIKQETYKNKWRHTGNAQKEIENDVVIEAKESRNTERSCLDLYASCMHHNIVHHAQMPNKLLVR